MRVIKAASDLCKSPRFFYEKPAYSKIVTILERFFLRYGPDLHPNGPLSKQLIVFINQRFGGLDSSKNMYKAVEGIGY